VRSGSNDIKKPEEAVHHLSFGLCFILGISNNSSLV